MKHTRRLDRIGIAFSSLAALAALAACGGGGSDPGAAPAPAPAPTTTDVAVTVIDGAIGNALVCLDQNGNGQCDSGEPQGRTGTDGKVTLTVPNADVGTAPIVALVGTDAVDADTGPVTVAYALSAPADQTALVSPLTTLVQQTAASTGATTVDAAASVQGTLGTTASPLADYTKASAPSDGSINPATVARLVVLATQAQVGAVASAIGGTAIDGSTITQSDANRAIQAQVLTMLPDLAAAAGAASVLAATTAADREAALQAQAQAVAAASGLTAASLPTAVGVVKQAAVATPAVAPSAGYNLRALSFTDTSNYSLRVFSGSLAQNTPDANNNARYLDRRRRVVAGNVAAWGSGSDPWRGADLHWNGSAWANCPINFENISSVRDAQGNSTYNYCDGLETGRSNRASFDVGGRAMSDVYAQLRTAGYTDLTLANPAVLGAAVFPSGSKVYYQVGTPLTEAIAYYPGGANFVYQYSAQVTAGGDAPTQPAGTGCNAPETATNAANVTSTFEALIAAMTGTPCVYGQGTFVYGGVTYTSDVPNEWWGNSTVSVGTLGSAPVGSGAAPGFYTSNTLLRIAFKGSGTNPVTYYACRQRFNNGSIRNCTPIGTGSYTIATLGDARVMTLSNPPVQAASLTYTRVFVERGGRIYYGYQGKTIVNNTARLNTVGADAFLAQLGITPDNPDTPLALTVGSYQGTWDVRGTTETTGGTTVFFSAAGTSSCQDRTTFAGFACTLTVTNPATGAFTYTDASSTASGTFDFLSGAAGGTYHDPTTTPIDGQFAGERR